jgi:cell division protein FtsL
VWIVHEQTSTETVSLTLALFYPCRFQYNKQNAARARERAKNLVSDLQQTIHSLSRDISGLRNSNQQLKSEVNMLLAASAVESATSLQPPQSPAPIISLQQSVNNLSQDIAGVGDSNQELQLQMELHRLMRLNQAADTMPQGPPALTHQFKTPLLGHPSSSMASTPATPAPAMSPSWLPPTANNFLADLQKAMQ